MSGPCNSMGLNLGGGIHGFSALIQGANEQVSFVCVDFHFSILGMHLGGACCSISELVCCAALPGVFFVGSNEFRVRGFRV